MLITAIQKNFLETIMLLNQLDSKKYTFCNPELSNATIGEHIRHIIELYQSLIEHYDSGIINYDKRKRNIVIQTSINEAILAIESILAKIDLPNKELQLEDGVQKTNFTIQTNYFRELLYNLEHSIHHQALIKVAVLKYQDICLPENFGIAKSTIEFKSKCVQ
ncbi:DinB family protein [Flavobacterium jejuense]|uniref:DinB family protein n=1 Tax=Flavobacterium jejuense TaxID=1544455 RepID=A0ABX0IM83_9FLAO|nr:DinB family protein [Flavobacterium jejuense]NHN24907.1 DinB family protein [Flavobacterium jejuense]